MAYYNQIQILCLGILKRQQQQSSVALLEELMKQKYPNATPLKIGSIMPPKQSTSSKSNESKSKDKEHKERERESRERERERHREQEREREIQREREREWREKISSLEEKISVVNIGNSRLEKQTEFLKEQLNRANEENRLLHDRCNRLEENIRRHEDRLYKEVNIWRITIGIGFVITCLVLYSTSH